MEMSKMDIDRDKCVFFDDIPDNHYVPKVKLNWITVLIGTTYPDKQKPYFIDFYALFYFSLKISNDTSTKPKIANEKKIY